MLLSEPSLLPSKRLRAYASYIAEARAAVGDIHVLCIQQDAHSFIVCPSKMHGFVALFACHPVKGCYSIQIQPPRFSELLSVVIR